MQGWSNRLNTKCYGVTAIIVTTNNETKNGTCVPQTGSGLVITRYKYTSLKSCKTSQEERETEELSPSSKII